VAVELAGLLVVNAAYFLVGVALLELVGGLTYAHVGIAYPLGLAAVVIPASYVALLGVPVGITATISGVVLVGTAVVRMRARGRLAPLPRPALPGFRALPALALGVVIAVLLAYAARTFAIRPLVEWDGWAVWSAKARLLYVDPGAAPAALRSGNYGQTPYPLGLPTIEALGFGAMGRYDPTLIGVQLYLLALGFPAALWSLLRGRARSWLIALTALTVVCAPQILYQLLTHYADVPLALFVGLGLAAGAAWLAGPRDPWLLTTFAVLLGLAGLIKSEGFLFALVGGVALAACAVADRANGLRPPLLGVAALLAVILPWRVYCAAYGLSTPDYDLNHVADPSYLNAHRDRVGPVIHELWRQLVARDKWGLLVWAIPLALAAGFLAGRRLVASFALVWLALSAVGLVVLYWASTLPLASNLTNTSYRTIVSLLVGGASLIPLLALPPPERRRP
jgi:hypothetical protein